MYRTLNFSGTTRTHINSLYTKIAQFAPWIYSEFPKAAKRRQTTIGVRVPAQFQFQTDITTHHLNLTKAFECATMWHFTSSKYSVVYLCCADFRSKLASKRTLKCAARDATFLDGLFVVDVVVVMCNQSVSDNGLKAFSLVCVQRGVWDGAIYRQNALMLVMRLHWSAKRRQNKFQILCEHQNQSLTKGKVKINKYKFSEALKSFSTFGVTQLRSDDGPFEEASWQHSSDSWIRVGKGKSIGAYFMLL